MKILKAKLQKFVSGCLNQHPLKSAALLGGLFTLGFAPLYLWVVSLLALAGLYKLTLQASCWKNAAKIGFVFGFVHHITGIHWIARSMYAEYGSWWVVASLGVLAVVSFSAYLALYISATVTVFRKCAEKFRTPLVFTLLWLFFEYVRAQLPNVFPWNLSGYVWADNNGLLQLAAYGEIWLMSFVFVLAASLLMWRGRQGLLLSLVLVGVCWSAGNYRLINAELQPIDISMRLVQGSVPQTEKWDKAKRREHMSRYIDLSHVGQGNDVDFIIWPEMSVLYDITRPNGFKELLMEKIGDTHLLVGALRLQESATPKTGYLAYNGAFVLNPNGGILQEFDKQHLIPYGEFIPLREYLPNFVMNMVGHRTDYAPGKKSRLMSLPKGKKAVVLICSESAIPSLSSHLYKNADFLINITNDSWFDNTAGPSQHLAMSKVRATSAHLPLIRVANTGHTVVINRYGVIKKRIKTNQQGVLNLDTLTQL